MSFFYSFIGMLLHSIWQAGLLALLYICVTMVANNTHPLQRRNLLYGLLSVQAVVSIFTFILYFTEKDFGLPTSLHVVSFYWLHNYANIIFSFYCVVVLYKFSSVIFQWNVFIKSYRKSLLKTSAELKIFTQLKAYQLGIKRKVTVWYCKNIESPITFGFLKPMILLPFSLVNAISTDEVETIILHELAHIKSKDYLLNWLLLGMEIVYFFNPFIRLLTNKIKLEREKNCDVQVLNFDYNEILYAQTLLKIAQNTLVIKSFQLGAVKQTSQLLQRIQFFSTKENRLLKHHNVSILGWVLIPILLLTTTLFLQKKQPSNYTSTAYYSKAFFAPINQSEKINIYFDLSWASDIPLTTTKSRKKSNNNVAKIKEKKLNISKFTFNKPDIFEENIYPVSYNETADSVKEFLYNVETQQGKMTQSYKLIQRNGRWILEPKWMIVERNNDSAFRLIADTIFNRIDSIQ